MALSAGPLERPHGKGLAQPEAPTGEGGGSAPWGKSPMIWPDLDDPEGRARFVLDDSSEAYLWRGLKECERASVEAINRASELMSQDMYKLAQVRSPSPIKCLLFASWFRFPVQHSISQALKATSLEKSVFLRRERDAWAVCENEKAAREAAEGELARECEISAELRQKCSDLATEAREAQEKVAPLEKRVSDLILES